MAGCALDGGPDAPGDDDAVFEVGETWVYACNLVAVAGTQNNTATADSNQTPQDSDDATYLGTQAGVTDPAVTKSGDPAQLRLATPLSSRS